MELELLELVSLTGFLRRVQGYADQTKKAGGRSLGFVMPGAPPPGECLGDILASFKHGNIAEILTKVERELEEQEAEQERWLEEQDEV